MKPRGYYLELFRQAIFGVKVPNSSHASSTYTARKSTFIRHQRVTCYLKCSAKCFIIKIQRRQFNLSKFSLLMLRFGFFGSMYSVQKFLPTNNFHYKISLVNFFLLLPPGPQYIFKCFHHQPTFFSTLHIFYSGGNISIWHNFFSTSFLGKVLRARPEKFGK